MRIAGAGMAGLCAAARARELGAAPVVYEKGDRPGGSMLLSSGVVWRYREWDEFRRQCPDGDPDLQRLVFDRLDDALDWLRSLGAAVVWADTRNPLTTGVRFDPRGLTEALVAASGGEIRLNSGWDEPTILATGGFGASRELVDRYIAPAAALPLRANRWSTGDGLQLGLQRGAALTAGMDEFYGRNMADAPFAEGDFEPLAQLYGHRALVLDDHGNEVAVDPADWSETRLVQTTAGCPGAIAWYVLDDDALADPDVAARVDPARAVGAAARPSDLPFTVPPSARLAVRVRASITHTIGGLRVDTRARVLDEAGAPIDGLFAAGADVGGISTGGYASGLAAALVLGLVAAEAAG